MVEELGTIHPLMPPATGLLLLLVVAVIVYYIARHVVVRAVRAFARRTRAKWDDALVDHKVFARLAQVVPALIVYLGVPLVPELPESGVQLIRNVTMGDMVLTLTPAYQARYLH